ncbi:ATP-dependent nuclease [Chitinophaga sp. YR573]|uniref:ATP-dependent nuclease n=1 Tax=Chitinophaga sp. YR573 TaxID=1881040 RepID=UPI002100FEBE|nr:AAA family ATPase [Chitinophaga sp. YR573]
MLSRVTLKGFRNFMDATINLNDKTLVIGANDVGKTNLLWAIRLLLDRGLSDYDLEPLDSDFYAYEEIHSFNINLFFKNVTEDCVLSRLKGKVGENNELCLSYKAVRDKSTGAKSYSLYAGPDVDQLEEIQERYYLKVLNVKYIGSRRDLNPYVKREKAYLFQQAKENRSEEQENADDNLYQKILTDLKSVDSRIPKLNFIATATKTINEELNKLSLHHTKQQIVFDAVSSDVDNFINNVSIASNTNGQNVAVGGDGRLNQIYLALWASRNDLTEDALKEVTIFCIEEPEAHLHPHQQRKLADYLNESLKGQVLISSHSPQIASEFSPNAIVRLFTLENKTVAASKGCSKIIDDAFEDFGYRMSIIPAEAFFSDVVFLVEGPSEELFYKTLSTQIDVDLDMLNISILMVDGVGFGTFINILNSLEISWVLRTDNDISKVPYKEHYHFAGVNRCIGFYDDYTQCDPATNALIAKHGIHLTGFPTNMPELVHLKAAQAIIANLEKYDMYLSEKDLENDLINSAIKSDLVRHFNNRTEAKVIKVMQEKKAIRMYEFLKKNKASLAVLKDSQIAKPLLRCKELAELI